jgi:hypothetical protein
VNGAIRTSIQTQIRQPGKFYLESMIAIIYKRFRRYGSDLLTGEHR